MEEDVYRWFTDEWSVNQIACIVFEIMAVLIWTETQLCTQDLGTHTLIYYTMVTFDA